MRPAGRVMAAAVAGITGITFIGAGAVVTSSNPTVPVPSGYQAGDLLILVAGCATNVASLPSGWTSDYSGGTPSVRTLVCHKVAGASESSVALSVSSSATRAVMLCYRNTNSTPLDVAGAGVTGSSVTSVTTNSLTTTAANDLVVSVFVTSSGTITAPAGTTTRVNSSGSTFDGLLIVDEIQAAAGASTSRTATADAAVNWLAFSAAFKK